MLLDIVFAFFILYSIARVTNLTKSHPITQKMGRTSISTAHSQNLVIRKLNGIRIIYKCIFTPTYALLGNIGPYIYPESLNSPLSKSS